MLVEKCVEGLGITVAWSDRRAGMIFFFALARRARACTRYFKDGGNRLLCARSCASAIMLYADAQED